MYQGQVSMRAGRVEVEAVMVGIRVSSNPITASSVGTQIQHDQISISLQEG